MTRRSVFPSRSFLPIAFGMCVLLGSLASEHGLPGLLKARAQSEQLAADIAALKTENAELRVRADQLQHDRSAIERIARRDFGLARPDEVVVTIKRASAAAKP